MDKKNLSESDISDKFIRPAIVRAGWHTLDQIYAQYPLRAGRVVDLGDVFVNPHLLHDDLLSGAARSAC